MNQLITTILILFCLIAVCTIIGALIYSLIKDFLMTRRIKREKVYIQLNKAKSHCHSLRRQLESIEATLTNYQIIMAHEQSIDYKALIEQLISDINSIL